MSNKTLNTHKEFANKKVIVFDVESTGKMTFAIGAVFAHFFLFDDGSVVLKEFEKKQWSCELPPDQEWDQDTLQWFPKNLKSQFESSGKGISQQKMFQDFYDWFRNLEVLHDPKTLELWTDTKDFDTGEINQMIYKYYPGSKSMRYSIANKNYPECWRTVFDIDDAMFLAPKPLMETKSSWLNTFAKGVVHDHTPANDAEYIFWNGVFVYFLKCVMEKVGK